MSDPTAGEHRALAIAEKADEMVRANPDLRRGQAMFNALHMLDPALADHLRGSTCDPFHRDDRINAFLGAVKAGLPTDPDAGDVDLLTLAAQVWDLGAQGKPLGELADAILASDWLASREAAAATRARAEALREAARDLPGLDMIRTHGDAANWLRARADSLADTPARTIPTTATVRDGIKARDE